MTSISSALSWPLHYTTLESIEMWKGNRGDAG